MSKKAPNLYCVKCRRKTANATPLSRLMARNGTPMIQTECKVCGTKKTQFVSSKN